MERSLLNRSKGLSSQRLFVMPDNHDAKRTHVLINQQRSTSLKRSTPIEDKENVNPDTFELAQHESRQRRHRLPQSHTFSDDCNFSKPAEEAKTPQECKSRPPLRDITPIFQKVPRCRLCCCNLDRTAATTATACCCCFTQLARKSDCVQVNKKTVQSSSQTTIPGPQQSSGLRNMR